MSPDFLNKMDSLFSMMYATNPKFKKLADSVKGKTPEQAFSEHGLSFSEAQSKMPELFKSILR